MNSLALTFNSMSSSIGIAMQNATTNQRSGQLIATTTLAIACKLILSKGSKGS